MEQLETGLRKEMKGFANKILPSGISKIQF